MSMSRSWTKKTALAPAPAKKGGSDNPGIKATYINFHI